MKKIAIVVGQSKANSRYLCPDTNVIVELMCWRARFCYSVDRICKEEISIETVSHSRVA